MKSIRELYKIGYGPSSSHTMGPQKACEIFKSRYPDAVRFRVILYGSLAATGRGHLTDQIIEKTLGNVTVVFDDTFVLWHPNTMDIFGYSADEKQTYYLRAYSVGGGSIRIENETTDELQDVYPHQTFEDIKQYCLEHQLRLYQYVEKCEGQEIWDFLNQVYETMMSTIDRGLNAEGILPGELRVERKAKQLLTPAMTIEPPEITESRLVSAYAYACAEENASGHIVVTAPTCGSSGIVPSVLKYMKDRHKFRKQTCLNALATAGLIGNIIKHNASISGAIAGCQAEVGSASAMAAAMHAELFRLSLDQIEYASEISLEHHLGLTCDPVLGYVQIPCIERNAVGALRAIDACGLAFFLAKSRKISLDMVIDTMYRTGQDIHTKYRETGIGGLALLYGKYKNEGKKG
ncbi:MAG: L-serine ammonia-lyase, iron-sulfur-dependent, subunit alpha [Candidatus Izemoplasmatales bacterium]|nr:L-serine ammonia-lyase, iron-sulfur-dependent, subunit alpha [Candidatus Izemoplasmatales bacterium]MDD4354935.1 L-serine ammonia-lyase, iron-sulfur-dependent, subunit alpha [Candidatus Izemoplasmatales bacterium]MDD4987882.1 L-serine ammonia-lyase, iron-sulfur-dependent, subunit alpha [Candidatus Izemoplasmatales bacterium]MDD5602121.1 L-serine ammonia-lyase, iron-sulfur-dependent, subunit alpha [Candidatus Izemoplasmatales bacterium]